MTQRQITNNKSDNLLIQIDSARVLPEIILKFRHLKYRRCVKYKVKTMLKWTKTRFLRASLKCDTPCFVHFFL